MDNKNNQPVNPEEPKKPSIPKDRAYGRGTFRRKDDARFDFTTRDNKGPTPKRKDDGYHKPGWSEGHSRFADWSTDELVKYLGFINNKPKPEDLEENPEGGYRV